MFCEAGNLLVNVISGVNGRDLLEICFFFVLFYKLFDWCSKSSYPNLLFSCYGYLALIGFSFLIDTTTVTFFLMKMLPLISVLFVLVHQETIQKALFLPKRIMPAHMAQDHDWIDTFMRALLRVLHTKESIACVIEREHCLEGMITSHSKFEIPFSHQSLLKILSLYEPKDYVWIRDPGICVALDATIHDIDQKIGADHCSNIAPAALALTYKTDALVLQAHARDQLFTVVAAGVVVEAMPVTAALRLLRNYLSTHRSERDHKKDTHRAAVN